MERIPKIIINLYRNEEFYASKQKGNATCMTNQKTLKLLKQNENLTKNSPVKSSSVQIAEQ